MPENIPHEEMRDSPSHARAFPANFRRDNLLYNGNNGMRLGMEDVHHDRNHCRF